MRSMKKLGLLAAVWLLLATCALAANITVATVADLATARPGDGDVIELCGYSAINDGGGGRLVYDFDSAATVDAGVVFTGPGGVGRYIRLWSDHVNILWYGDCDAGGVDVAPLLRKAMVHGDVYFPPGTYDFDSFVNLRSNRKYFGASGYRSILRRASTQKHILAVANYDYENFDEMTFVEAKENIEICDLVLDWYLDAGWVSFAALIQLEGYDTGNDDRLENISIKRCKFIDSFSVAHPGADDAWAINYSSDAPTQDTLTIEDCRCEAEGHQFCAAGGQGWTNVRIRRNYMYHPHANGITTSTLSPDAVWNDIEISDNEIVGPYSLGIWVGPDQQAATGYQVYRNIKIQNNKVTFDSYSDASSLGGVYVNVYEGLTDDIHISDNQISYADDFSNAAAPLAIKLVNNGARSASVASDYTQPAVGASVDITLDDSSDFAVGSLLNVSGGGTYEITDIDTGTPNQVSGELQPFYLSAPTGSTIAMSTSCTSFGSLSSVLVSANKCGDGRIYLAGTTNATVIGNDSRQLVFDQVNRAITAMTNDVTRITCTSHLSGVIASNRLHQFDDSGGFGSISITPGSWNGFTSENSVAYVDNVLTSLGETGVIARFVYETGQGVFSSQYYGNVAKGTSATGIRLAHAYAAFTADDMTDTCTAASHGIYDGQKVTLSSTSVIPAPLSTSTTYYVVGRTTNTFQLSTTRGGSAINITSTGSGTHYVTPTRLSVGNVFDSANSASGPASAVNYRYYSATLDFDLSAVNSETLTVVAPGATTGSIVFVSVPSSANADGATWSAKLAIPGTLRVTCSRTDQATGVNPGSGSFQFIVAEPR